MTLQPLRKLALPNDNPWYDSHRILNLVKGEGQDMLSQYLGKWQLFDYRDNPRPTLNLFVPENGAPAVTISRNRNDTLKVTGNPKLAAERHPGDYRAILHNALIHQCQTALLNWLQQRFHNIDLPHVLFQWDRYTTFAKDIEDIVNLHIRLALDSHSVNGVRHQLPHPKALRKLSGIIAKKIINKEVESLADRYHPNRDHWLEQYNAVARNLRTFRTMDRESPKVLAAWCRLHGKETVPNIGTPGQLTHAVREHLQPTPAQWKLFTKTGLAFPPQQTHEQDITLTRLGLKALTQANCPQAPKPVARLMLHEHSANEYFATADWLRGDPWTQWVHLIAATLRDAALNPADYHHSSYPYDSQVEDLVNASWDEHPTGDYSKGYTLFKQTRDALRHHVANNLPWPLSSLETYHRRSNAWHAAQKSRNAQEKEARLEAQRWHSCLDTTKMPNGVTAVPVTNALELTRLSREMDNCLTAYIQACLNGATRIFKLIAPEGKLLSAVEISNFTGNWIVAQNEASNHGRPPDEALAAGLQLARLYRQAEQKTNPAAGAT